MTPTLDFAATVVRADMRRIVEADLGPPGPGGKWVCPFHDDHSPSMALTPGGLRFKCWSCGAGGTALDWLMLRDGLTIVEAARRLNGADAPARPRKQQPKPAPKPVPSPKGWQHPEWQAAAEELVRRAEAELWRASGREALAWLRARGLADDTVQRFRLGFLPESGQHGGISFARGITLPWVHPEGWPSAFGNTPEFRWVGVNVRRLRADVREPWEGPGKCRAFNGSQRGFPYPLAGACPGVPAIVTEGEWDALLAWQELGHAANPLNFGGASAKVLPPASLADLAACPGWLVATHHDPAGDEAARFVAGLGPHKAHRAFLPSGNDLNDFIIAGGDALAWLRSEFRRVGLG